MIGRDKEQKALNDFLKSKTSEFVVVYGRRRVGKTYLIREHFKTDFTFHTTGLANTTLQLQLLNFYSCLQQYNTSDAEIPIPKNWFEAFQLLKTLLTNSNAKKKVVFIDELPWFDTPKSYFISALEHFWNSWASGREDILLITCGSAASWMLNKLINNKGGLHNRVTQRMKIVPFTLKECELFLKSKNIYYNRYQIVEMYSILGGIPYYLNTIEKGLSITQNIDKICFTENGLLKNEFDNLYASLFKNAENHIAIITALAKKTKGLTRNEIITTGKITNGGGTTKVLEELVESGFIRKYIPIDKKTKDSIYQLTDFYSLFYLKFIKDNKQANENFWINAIDNPLHRSWSGYAFEQVCLMHLPEIKTKLGISGILTSEASWRSASSDNGAQIDLLIDRRDQVVNLCEMKFSINEFTVDKKYATELRNKIGTFKTETKTKKAVFLTMITTFGIKQNEYSLGLIQNELTIEDLF
jgi:AAA+ ATPase superfamily predicted ATPase